MSYPREVLVGCVLPESNWTQTAQSLTQAAATYGVFAVRKPVVVQEISFRLSSLVKDLTGSVVAAQLITFTNGTATTAQFATLTIPTVATANTTYYNNSFTPTLVPANSQIQFVLKTQGALGGTPTGAGFCGFYATFSPEENTNETGMFKLSL